MAGLSRDQTLRTVEDPELSFQRLMPGANKDPYIDIVGLPSPLRRDKRCLPQTNPVVMYGFVMLLPFWLGTVALWSLIYQVATRLLRHCGFIQAHVFPPLDSGHKAPEKLKPRKERTYDIVVLGVTGFTGRLAARHLAEKYGVNKGGIKWAIAGRSRAKLDDVKQSLADELNMPEIVDGIDVIIADTSDPTTMPGLVQDTRVIATTAGPYQEYGNTVVEFAAKYGTHYVDITGEVGWVKHMMIQHGNTAKKTGAKIVPFCGHDCIPWDLTVFKLNQILQEKFQDELRIVKVWDEAEGAAPGGTLQTIMLLLDGKSLPSANKQDGTIDPFLQLPDGTKSTHSTVEDLPSLPDPFFDGRWTGPYAMAMVNSKIVRWTHALRQKGASKMLYRETQVHRDYTTVLCYMLRGVFLLSVLLNPITKWFAFKFFLPQPGSGPKRELMEEKFYLLVSAEGIGANGNRAESTFYVPKDAGCLYTAIMLVESGLAMALHETQGEGKQLPSGSEGGFFPPAVAMGDVLMARLLETGIEYQSRTVGKDEQRIKDAAEKEQPTIAATPEPKDKDA